MSQAKCAGVAKVWQMLSSVCCLRHIVTHTAKHTTHTHTGHLSINAAAELAGRKSAAELGERLHVGLVQLLMGEAYEATSNYLMSTIPLPLNRWGLVGVRLWRKVLCLGCA